MKNKINISFTLSVTNIEKLKRLAKKDNRTMSNFIENLLSNIEE